MKDKLYFVSDIHFGAENLQKEFNKRRLFAYFLDEICADGKALYIVGDLFDFWFEYKHVILAEHFEVVAMLDKAIKNGLEIHYVAGNHDFWIGDFLSNKLNIKLHLEPDVIVDHSKRFFLCHGDGVAKRDVGYRLLKRVLRFKLNIKLYRWLHPDIGIPLAKFVSGSSRKYTNNIDLMDHDDYLDYAKQEMLNRNADFALMGHRHNPLVHKFEDDKTYVNLGDWLFNFTYAQFNGQNLELLNLKDKMNQFKLEQENGIKL